MNQVGRAGVTGSGKSGEPEEAGAVNKEQVLSKVKHRRKDGGWVTRPLSTDLYRQETTTYF